MPYRLPVRRFALLSITLLAAACAGPRATIPQGLEVVEPEAPPPSPAAIEEAQRRLQALDLYPGPITGTATPATRVALARFQRLEGLEVTGTLDEATAAALGVGAPLRGPGSGRQTPQQAGPSAAEMLAREEVPALPQPPPEALTEARRAAARLLALGAAQASGELARAGLGTSPEAIVEIDPGQGEGAPPAGAEIRTDEVPVVPEVVRAAGQAQQALGEARKEAFARLLEARQSGGYALLPQVLLDELEQALQRRALLLRGPDGRFGPDDQAAVRWVQRSIGQPVDGLPTLPLLEALGIDPTPMFE